VTRRPDDADPLDAEQFSRAVAARTDEAHDPITSLCLACADVLGVRGAALLLISGKRLLGCVGVSDLVTEAVEQVEYTLGDGPCMAAYRTKTPVFDADLGDDETDRWPEFRRGALAVGIRAAFGFPLLIDQVCIGAMNLYHDRAGALTDMQAADAQTVAQIASRTLLDWQADAPPGKVAWQLEKVPNHRMEVHQAAGRISVQAEIPVYDALALLRAYAFAEDRTISEVAHDVALGVLRFD
jgi:hypothetical protein